MKWKIYGDRHVYPMSREGVFVPKEMT